MDSIPDWLSVVLLVLLVALSAFFSASETSFACCNRYKFMAEADSGKKSAKTILRLADSFETTLITTLSGYNIVSIVTSATPSPKSSPRRFRTPSSASIAIP